MAQLALYVECADSHESWYLCTGASDQHAGAAEAYPKGSPRRSWEQWKWNRYPTCTDFCWIKPVLLIRDIYPGSRILGTFFPSWIPVPRSRIVKIRIRIKELSIFKGTVSWERFQKFWQKYTELGLTKGRGWFLNLLWASMILKYKKFIYCG